MIIVDVTSKLEEVENATHLKALSSGAVAKITHKRRACDECNGITLVSTATFHVKFTRRHVDCVRARMNRRFRENRDR